MAAADVEDMLKSMPIVPLCVGILNDGAAEVDDDDEAPLLDAQSMEAVEVEGESVEVVWC